MACYRLSEQAKGDLERIYLYGIEQFGEAQADRYFQALFECFDVIAETPYRYPAADDVQLWYWRCVCGEGCVYFRVFGDTIEVVAIVGRQFSEGG